MRSVYNINQFIKRIVNHKPVKLTLGIIIGIILLIMGMKEVTAYSFPKESGQINHITIKS